MTAQVRIYNGAVSNPESDLIKTLSIQNVKSVTEENGKITIYKQNGESFVFGVNTSKIIIE